MENCKKWEWNWQSISVFRSELMGAAILWIMLFHSKMFPPIAQHNFIGNSIVYQLIRDGGSGVDIFLFLSGMGIYFSWEKNQNLLSFYKKRVIRILPTYISITGIYWLIYIHYFSPDLSVMALLREWVANVSGYTWFTRGTLTFWYIPAQIIFYIAAPFFLIMFKKGKVIKNTVFMAAIIAVLCGLYLLSRHESYSNFDIAIGRIPVFLMGCFIGEWVQEKRPMSKMWCLTVIPAAFGCKIILGWMLQQNSAFVILARGRNLFIAFAACYMICFFLSEMQSNRINACLRWFGTHSLELYLLHIGYKNLSSLYFMDWVNQSTVSALVVYGGVIVLSCVTAWIWRKIIH